MRTHLWKRVFQEKGWLRHNHVLPPAGLMMRIEAGLSEWDVASERPSRIEDCGAYLVYDCGPHTSHLLWQDITCVTISKE